jgi:hypothetical protein
MKEDVERKRMQTRTSGVYNVCGDVFWGNLRGYSDFRNDVLDLDRDIEGFLRDWE